MSTLCSRARRRAFGEILAPATDAGAAGSGAAAAAAAAGAESILRPLICGAPSLAGTDSPAFSSHAMICPTGTTSSTLAVTPASTPSLPASISTTALSVSTSSRISPFLTCSPSFFFHDTSLPVSCAISSAGITTLVAIYAPTLAGFTASAFAAATIRFTSSLGGLSVSRTIGRVPPTVTNGAPQTSSCSAGKRVITS